MAIQLAAFLSVGLLVFCSPLAASNYFGNVSINRLNWSKGTKQRVDFQEDFSYLELEGGGILSWGELYGFYDLEDITQPKTQWRKSFKVSVSVKLFPEQPLRVYTQHFSHKSDGFDTANTVLGVAYRMTGQQGFVMPWLGWHYEASQTEAVDSVAYESRFHGSNGLIMGLSGMYSFTWAGQSFSLSSWHETEFYRDENYLEYSGLKDTLSMNGALGFWWHPIKNLTPGLQYRYSYNTLGAQANQNGLIYTLRYVF